MEKATGPTQEAPDMDSSTATVICDTCGGQLATAQSFGEWCDAHLDRLARAERKAQRTRRTARRQALAFSVATAAR